jgi:large subunit ribosomal protein L6
MSRKGKQPVLIPSGVEVKIEANSNGSLVSVKGPKGSLSQDVLLGLIVKKEDNQVTVELAEDAKSMGNFHGLYRGIINNMVHGVSHGFEKKLEMQGVGYRAVLQGHLLDIQVGTSHPIKLEVPKDLHVKVEKNIISVTGADKQKVGQFAANVRAKKPPEPYQGKGIRYVGEYVRRKAGKSAAKK